MRNTTGRNRRRFTRGAHSCLYVIYLFRFRSSTDLVRLLTLSSPAQRSVTTVDSLATLAEVGRDAPPITCPLPRNKRRVIKKKRERGIRGMHLPRGHGVTALRNGNENTSFSDFPPFSDENLRSKINACMVGPINWSSYQ